MAVSVRAAGISTALRVRVITAKADKQAASGLSGPAVISSSQLVVLPSPRWPQLVLRRTYASDYLARGHIVIVVPWTCGVDRQWNYFSPLPDVPLSVPLNSDGRCGGLAGRAYTYRGRWSGGR